VLLPIAVIGKLLVGFIVFFIVIGVIVGAVVFGGKKG
jgi:hypothetical protein